MENHKPNGQSCMIEATCRSTGIPFSVLAGLIGHDGEQTGTSLEEIVTALVDLNWTCTQIVRQPRAFDCRTMSTEELNFFNSPKYRNSEERWDWMLLAGDGIVQGYRKNGNAHAMAWVDGKLYDRDYPQGMLMNEPVFRPFRFCLISQRGGV